MLALLLAASHLLALLSLLTLPFSNGLLLGAALLLLLHYCYRCRQADGQYSQRVRAVARADKEWLLFIGPDQRRRAVELQTYCVWRCLLTADFRDVIDGRRYSLTVLPDSCCSEQFRALQVALRMS